MPSPPPEFDGSPAEQVRQRLARSRRNGRDFEDAWQRALVGIAWPGGGDGRRSWLPVLEETEAAWRAAYLREPAPGLDAVGVLAQDLDGLMAA